MIICLIRAKLFSNVHRSSKLPKYWKKAKVIAVLKPDKKPEKVEHYRPISLLSCCFKLFERAILSRIRDVLETAIPVEQAGFSKGRNCCDQVLALTNLIELGYEKGLKTGVIFLDLSAAYDTVWKKGLMYKLSKIIPCRMTSKLIMSMLTDRTFQVTINGKESRKRVLNNGLPQGSVLSCFLYCVYTSDLPKIQQIKSRLFIYADDIAIAYQSNNFEDIENVLNEDLNELSNYFKDWRLKANTAYSISQINKQIGSSI